jgi:hypothetical protein
MIAGLGHPAVNWGSSLRASGTATTVIPNHQPTHRHPHIDPDHNYWQP